MSFMIYTANTNTVVDVRLTAKGRELLTKGLNEHDFFDIIKFSFGDSEIDYSLNITATTASLQSRTDSDQVDFNSKLYVSGTIPSGTPVISLTNTIVNLSKYQKFTVGASTGWEPVSGTYIENYKWVNLGPLQDYDYNIIVDSNTRSATIVAYEVVGTTKIKVIGQTSGKYTILTLTIS